MMPRGRTRFSVECQSIAGTALREQVVAQARMGATSPGNSALILPNAENFENCDSPAVRRDKAIF
jgi:hypothetical protein